MPKILPCPPQWGKGPEAQRGGGSNPTHTVCVTQLLRHMLGAGARCDTTCSPLMAQETSQSAADPHRVCTVLFACTPYCPEACHQSATKAYRNTAASRGSSSHAGARRAPSLRPMWRYANLSANCCGMSAPHPARVQALGVGCRCATPRPSLTCCWFHETAWERVALPRSKLPVVGRRSEASSTRADISAMRRTVQRHSRQPYTASTAAGAPTSLGDSVQQHGTAPACWPSRRKPSGR